MWKHPRNDRFGLTGEAVLDNIIYARAYTHEHLLQLLSLAAAKVEKSVPQGISRIPIQMVEEPYALLVIDSIMALFRVDFTGRGELAERQQTLGKTLSKLVKMAEQFNIAVVSRLLWRKVYFPTGLHEPCHVGSSSRPDIRSESFKAYWWPRSWSRVYYTAVTSKRQRRSTVSAGKSETNSMKYIKQDL